MSISTSTFNPMEVTTPEKLERGESQEAFQDGLGADVEKKLEMVVEKAAGKGFAATDAVNTWQVKRLFCHPHLRG